MCSRCIHHSPFCVYDYEATWWHFLNCKPAHEKGRTRTLKLSCGAKKNFTVYLVLKSNKSFEEDLNALEAKLDSGEDEFREIVKHCSAVFETVHCCTNSQARFILKTVSQQDQSRRWKDTCLTKGGYQRMGTPCPTCPPAHSVIEATRHHDIGTTLYPKGLHNA